MTVAELASKAHLSFVRRPDGEREVKGAYAGDLLSWVMGNARPDCAWVTIMTNSNIVAVATLVDLACVIIAEGAELPDEVAALADEKQVNVLSSALPVYETCAAISRLL